MNARHTCEVYVMLPNGRSAAENCTKWIALMFGVLFSMRSCRQGHDIMCHWVELAQAVDSSAVIIMAV